MFFFVEKVQNLILNASHTAKVFSSDQKDRDLKQKKKKKENTLLLNYKIFLKLAIKLLEK